MMAPRAARANGDGRDWTLLGTHGIVLFYVAANPESTMKEIAGALGITERWVARILKDLAGEMLIVRRLGRRNVYRVNSGAHLRHPALAHITLGELGKALSGERD